MVISDLSLDWKVIRLNHFRSFTWCWSNAIKWLLNSVKTDFKKVKLSTELATVSSCNDVTSLTPHFCRLKNVKNFFWNFSTASTDAYISCSSEVVSDGLKSGKNKTKKFDRKLNIFSFAKQRWQQSKPILINKICRVNVIYWAHSLNLCSLSLF